MSPRVLFALLAIVLSVASGVEALTQAQPTCKVGSYVVANTLNAACPLGRTASNTLTGVGSCCSCPPGTAGAKCDRCAPAQSTSTPSGVDEKSDPAGGCKCLAGYASYSSVTKTCTRCPVNTASADGVACRACAVLNQGTSPFTNNYYAAPGSKTCTQITCASGAINSFMPDGGYDPSHCRPCDATSTNGILYPSVCKCRGGFANFAVVTDASGNVRGSCTQQCTGNTVTLARWPVGQTGTGIPPQRCVPCLELYPASQYQNSASYFANADRTDCIVQKPAADPKF